MSEESEFAMELVEDEAESESEPVDRDELGRERETQCQLAVKAGRHTVEPSFWGFLCWICLLQLLVGVLSLPGSYSRFRFYKSPSAVRMDRANS